MNKYLFSSILMLLFFSANAQNSKGVPSSSQSATNGQVLAWNGTTNHWEPTTVSAGGSADNWGTQTVATAATLSGNGTAASPLTLASQGAVTGQAILYDGTSWVPGNVTTSAALLPNKVVFVASGTYTPTAGMKYIIVEAVSAGGGGGGALPTTTGGQASVGSGGGAGGYAKVMISAAQIGASKSVIIGTQGTGGSIGGNGTDGGGVEFPAGGSLLWLSGGARGRLGTIPSSPSFPTTVIGGSGGGPSVNTTANSSTFSWGAPGTNSYSLVDATTKLLVAGAGGAPPLMGVATAPFVIAIALSANVTTNGANGGALSSTYGYGGNGGLASGTSIGATGADGGPAILIITEYF